MKFRIWRMTSGTSEVIESEEYPVCGYLDETECALRANWSLTWIINRTGLPNLGKHHSALACGAHMEPRVAAIPFQYTSTVTIAPLKES